MGENKYLSGSDYSHFVSTPLDQYAPSLGGSGKTADPMENSGTLVIPNNDCSVGPHSL